MAHQLSSVAWSANRLDIFGIGTDNACWHMWWNGNHSVECSAVPLKLSAGARTGLTFMALALTTPATTNTGMGPAGAAGTNTEGLPVVLSVQ